MGISLWKYGKERMEEWESLNGSRGMTEWESVYVGLESVYRGMGMNTWKNKNRCEKNKNHCMKNTCWLYIRYGRTGMYNNLGGTGIGV